VGLYNVVKPCVVGDLHYARPATAPIEVDDKVALPLVDEGKLEPVNVFVAPALGVDYLEPFSVVVDDQPAEGAEVDETPTRRRRRNAEDGE
jgi:hypothetical protein